MPRTNTAPTVPARRAVAFLAEIWHELVATGLFEVSTGERFVAHMIDRIERRA